MKKRSKTFLMIITAVVVIFGFAGCDWFLDVLIAPDGYVYDAKTGEPISGVTVQLKRENGTVAFTATSGSTGYYTFTEGVEYGTFELTATKTGGYVFTEQIVDVTGISQTLPKIGGFIPGDEVFSVVVFWDEGFDDVDAYLTMPNGDVGTGTVDPDNFYDSTTAVTTGFFPIPSTGDVTERISVHNSNTEVYDPTNSAVLVAELDIDNVGGVSDIPGGPETISVYTFPFYTSPAGSYTPAEADRSSLPLTGNYAWVGTMEYWLDAWTGDNENASSDTYGSDDPDALLVSSDFSVSAADPVVYIFDSTGQKGSFTLPKYIDIETASILRINLFYDVTDGAYTEYFQFLPNINAYASYDSIDRALSSAEPIVIKGRSRK